MFCNYLLIVLAMKKVALVDSDQPHSVERRQTYALRFTLFDGMIL
jgi:hypothetical protein